MGRSTFEGPILSGDNRFGPQRNVGYARLSQVATIDFANTTGANTAGYPGSSGQFVTSNGIPNSPTTVYSPSSTVSPSVVVTPTADASTAIYRGVVFYVPTNCQIESITVDYITALSLTSSTLTAVDVFVSNGFVTSSPRYATATLGTTTVGTAGRISTTYTATNLNNLLSTPTDILIPTNNPSGLSQIVATLSIVGTGLSALVAGKLNIDINYIQQDDNIGTSTAYPYGNFD
jgi:hypothetical protein